VYNTVHHILTNPVYAGAYVFGRMTTQTRTVGEHTVKTRGVLRPQADWEVLIHDHHDAYIPWPTYERNRQQIMENARMQGRMTIGPARSGKSLLAGLLRCARCGRKLHVTYSGTAGTVPRYGCRGAMINHGTDKCISFGGLALDVAVEQEILRVIEPAAVEAALGALSALEGQRDERRVALELTLRQAHYEAERARRQYDAVEPENRLVADELERRWNRALEEVERVRGDLARIPAPLQPLTAEERPALLTLANDFPSIWRYPGTSMAMKKRIVRALIEEIMTDVDDATSMVECVIRWAGGCHTSLRVRKQRTGQHRFTAAADVIDVVRELAQVVSDSDIAAILNRLKMKTGKGNTWTEGRLRSLRHHHGIAPFAKDQERSWVTMQDAAQVLGISPMSVRRLIVQGVIRAKQIVPCAPWMIDKAVLESKLVQRAVRAITSGRRRRRPSPENPDQKTLDLQAL
jgi:hypothetical protein